MYVNSKDKFNTPTMETTIFANPIFMTVKSVKKLNINEFK